MYVTPSAPLSIGGVIDDAIRLYRDSFSRCWKLAFVPGLAAGLSQIVMLHYVPTYGVLSQFQTARIMAQHPLPGMVIVYMMVIGLLAFSFQGAVAAQQAAVARSDDSFTFWRGVATAFLRLPVFLLSMLLLYLTVAGTFAVVMLALMIPMAVLGHMQELARAIASGVLVILMFVVMIGVVGRLQLFMVAVYVDRKGPLAALKTSWRLTKGHWWRAMAILTIAMIMLGVLFLAASVLTNVEGYLTHYGAIHRFLLAPVLAIATTAVLYPLAAAMWVSMYNDFKLRREGGDLAARVGALSSA